MRHYILILLLYTSTFPTFVYDCVDMIFTLPNHCKHLNCVFIIKTSSSVKAEIVYLQREKTIYATAKRGLEHDLKTFITKHWLYLLAKNKLEQLDFGFECRRSNIDSDMYPSLLVVTGNTLRCLFQECTSLAFLKAEWVTESFARIYYRNKFKGAYKHH